MTDPPPTDDPDARPRVLALARRFGWNATSFQILERGFRYWFDGDDACVAYSDTGTAWVAAGAPLADAARLGEVAGRFIAAARAHGRRSAFFAAESRVLDRPELSALQIGEQPVWDPRNWPTSMSRSVKEQLRRAANKGVSVRMLAADEVRRDDAPVRRALERLIARWLGTRAMAPMGFLVDVQPFEFCEERRYFVAERDGGVVGFLAAVPVYARGGWLFEDFLRDPSAPNGTAELLIDAGMRAVAAEGSTYVTLGLAPLAGDVGTWLKLARRSTAVLYDFAGLHAFKAKLRPHGWEPIYLAYASDGSGNRALYDALAAFARGSLLRFGGATLLRGPAVVVRVLAALLVPWTILLALAPMRWFPDAAVKWGWVGFDVVLTVALFSLALRWRPWLGAALASLISVDALLTLVQIIGFDAPRSDGVGDALVMLISLVGPSLAALVLWGAVGHRLRASA
jgi:phosphatidylglycerol lysyltransferase